ncbi:hypothetical protein LTR09_009027 [Extremus antarcticus]|uniref:Uncharacterized protein n=1 Tax=Extremus antarcticus TaxID=702011 RepID=A0AAJ0D9L3_9PEZI|nr:hypothetical protein LTR09_009027 [Extremus antarcticus]
MCRGIAIRWRCGDEWRGWEPGCRLAATTDCAETNKERPWSIKEGTTAKIKESWKLRETHFKVKWCCSPACCRKSLTVLESLAVQREATLANTDSNARSAAYLRVGEARKAYESDCAAHFSEAGCFDRFLAGEGRGYSDREEHVAETVPMINELCFQPSRRSDSTNTAFDEIEAKRKHYHQILSANGGTCCTNLRSADHHGEHAWKYVKLHPEAVLSSWDLRHDAYSTRLIHSQAAQASQQDVGSDEVLRQMPSQALTHSGSGEAGPSKAQGKRPLPASPSPEPHKRTSKFAQTPSSLTSHYPVPSRQDEMSTNTNMLPDQVRGSSTNPDMQGAYAGETPSTEQAVIWSLRALVAQTDQFRAQFDVWSAERLPDQPLMKQLDMYCDRSARLPAMRARLAEIGAILAVQAPAPPEFCHDQLMFHWNHVLHAENTASALDREHGGWLFPVNNVVQGVFGQANNPDAILEHSLRRLETNGPVLEDSVSTATAHEHNAGAFAPSSGQPAAAHDRIRGFTPPTTQGAASTGS